MLEATIQDRNEQAGEVTTFKQSLELVEWALEEMGRALMDEMRDTLRATNEPLARESEEQAAKAKALRGSHEQLKPRVEAQARILSGDVDRAISEGRDEDAEAKRQESAGLEQNLRDIQAQAEACERRVGDLDAEQKQNYRTVFESNYPQLREGCVASEIALCRMLDSLWDGLVNFETESGLELAEPFLKVGHKLDLTPSDSGEEAPYFTSLRRWFGGRR